MLTGTCAGCKQRRLLVYAGRSCTCPGVDEKHTPVDDCPTRGRRLLVVRPHRPCGRQQRAREGSIREL